MSPLVHVPADVASWAAAIVGAWDFEVDVSWPRADSRVWRIRLAGGDVFVKVSPSVGAFRRECAAYLEVLSQLPGMPVPELIGSSSELEALITSAVEGEVVRYMSPRPVDVERRIHQLAGSVLARVHHARPTGAATAQGVETSRARAELLRDQADSRLYGCRSVLTTEDLSVVRTAADVLAESAVAAEIGFLHGDFQPRNWLWADGGSRLSLIDFEESGLGYCVEDFIWLFATTWTRRTDLRDAFLRGYGRTLAEDEDRLLAAVTVVAGLQFIERGVQLGIPVKIDNGLMGLRHARRILRPQPSVEP